MTNYLFSLQKLIAGGGAACRGERERREEETGKWREKGEHIE